MAVIVGKWKHELKVRDNLESGVLIEVVGRKSESIPLREECGSEKLRQLPLSLLPPSTIVPLVQFSVMLISDNAELR